MPVKLPGVDLFSRLGLKLRVGDGAFGCGSAQGGNERVSLCCTSAPDLQVRARATALGAHPKRPVLPASPTNLLLLTAA